MNVQPTRIEENRRQHARVGNTLYTAALIPVGIEKPNRFIPELVEQQTQIILANLDYILAQEGFDRSNVVSCRLYTVSLQRLLDRIDRIYRRHFEGVTLPIRTEIGVTELPRGAQVAMEFIASSK
jgi:enamine deaminase RidA (YjgF/YER057c/UK114 family)